MTTAIPAPTQNENARMDEWFDNMIATLTAHQFQIQENIASPQIQSFYEKLAFSNQDQIAFQGKQLAQAHFVQRIILEFVQIFFESNPNVPQKLAFYFTDSKVLAWVEINDDDEEMENHLITTEAKVNAKFHQFGFDVEMTIVEKCDEIPVPNHYKSVNFNVKT